MPGPRSLPPELLRRFDRWLARVRRDWPDRPPQTDDLVARHAVLPLVADSASLVALRRDGVLVSIPWRHPERVEPVTDARTRDLTLLRACVRYPDLAALKPTRGADDDECPRCHGTGVFEPSMPSVVCFCGGLGFLPRTWSLEDEEADGEGDPGIDLRQRSPQAILLEVLEREEDRDAPVESFAPRPAAMETPETAPGSRSGERPRPPRLEVVRSPSSSVPGEEPLVPADSPLQIAGLLLAGLSAVVPAVLAIGVLPDWSGTPLIGIAPLALARALAFAAVGGAIGGAIFVRGRTAPSMGAVCGGLAAAGSVLAVVAWTAARGSIERLELLLVCAIGSAPGWIVGALLGTRARASARGG